MVLYLPYQKLVNAGGTGPGPSNSHPSGSGNYPGGSYGSIVGVTWWHQALQVE